MNVKDRLIVLRAIKHGESDLVIHGIAQSGSRLNLIAKGALKSRKRFGGGVLEPTHYIQVSYKQRKGNEHGETLHFLEEAQLLEGFSGVRADYDRLETALYFLKLVAKISQEGDPDAKGIFDLLGHALRAAETSQNMARLKLLFEAKLLWQQGVLPPDTPGIEWLHSTLAEHDKEVPSETNLRLLQNHTGIALTQYVGPL